MQVYIERWAFSASELSDPSRLNAFDKLIAFVGETVAVNRNDISCGCETLYHPDTAEQTCQWSDVLTDDDGKFIGWATCWDC
jgi:hypothetical protein